MTALPKEQSFFVPNFFPSKVNSIVKPCNLLPEGMDSLVKDFSSLMLGSSSPYTWGKHCSALSLYNRFCNEFNIDNIFPIDIKHMRAFTTWALSSHGLQPSTVRSYLSSLKIVHELKDTVCVNFANDKCVKMLLKGANGTNITKKPARLAMNYHILKILSHRIANTNWCTMSKQVIWTAFTVCFFTSTRMGELVCKHENNLKQENTLTWNNVNFLSDQGVLLFIPHTKTTGYRGAFIDIFPIENSPYCPAAALRKLFKKCCKENTFVKSQPVFSFKSGKPVTTTCLNAVLLDLIPDLCDDKGKISCHSFRAGIPSMLAAHPNFSNIHEILEWGRWESDSFKRYTKNERDRKRELFKKIVMLLK